MSAGNSKKKVQKRDFGNFRSLKQHANGRIWPTRYDFLYIFYSLKSVEIQSQPEQTLIGEASSVQRTSRKYNV